MKWAVITVNKKLKCERWAVADVHVILQYSVPCLLLKYMKPDKLHRHNTEDYYFDLTCFVAMSERSGILLKSLGGNWPECMLDCKTLMLCNPSDMFAWAYSVHNPQRKGCKLLKRILKKKSVYTPHTREGFWSQSTTNSKQEIGN